MSPKAYIPPKRGRPVKHKERLNRMGEKPISSLKILKVVEEHFELVRDDLVKKCRKRETVYPRQVASYLLGYYSVLTLRGIGVLFGQQFTTVVQSIEAMQNYIDTDPNVKEQIDHLSKLISDDKDL